MFHSSVAALCAASVAFVGVGVGWAATPYVITDLGVTPTGASSFGLYGVGPGCVMAVNNSGQVVLSSLVGSNPHAFLDSAGTLTDLTSMYPTNTSKGYAEGINNNGVVVDQHKASVPTTPAGGLQWRDRRNVHRLPNGRVRYHWPVADQLPSYAINDSGWYRQ